MNTLPAVEPGHMAHGKVLEGQVLAQGQGLHKSLRHLKPISSPVTQWLHEMLSDHQCWNWT